MTSLDRSIHKSIKATTLIMKFTDMYFELNTTYNINQNEPSKFIRLKVVTQLPDTFITKRNI